MHRLFSSLDFLLVYAIYENAVEECRPHSRAHKPAFLYYPQLALWARRISPASLAYTICNYSAFLDLCECPGVECWMLCADCFLAFSNSSPGCQPASSLLLATSQPRAKPNLASLASAVKSMSS